MHSLLLGLQLVIHVAAGDEAWVDDAVATASDRLDHELTWTAGPTDDVPTEILTVAARDALAALDDGDAVHVFVVARVADKDEAGAWLGGVTWRASGHRYVIVAHDDARPDTLAHELGHFFGLRHQTAEDNLMTAPGRVDGARLTERQRKTVRRKIAAWLKRH